MPSYPVEVEARLDSRLSRGLWLVKWLLLIPHFIILVFLWVAFAVLTIVAFFAILFTARYPAAIFDFNVGVMRWSWRVSYYGYSALGTDRYPPFTLVDDPNYPARLRITYPGRLSRGLVLVKWWLLALPHYLILAFFVGGGTYFAVRDGGAFYTLAGGLIGLLVLIVGIALLFVGVYPRGLFDLLLGMNRWALRVAAYTGLMTDQYPPFQMDLGGSEPGDVPDIPPTPPTPGAAAAEPTTGPATESATGTPTESTTQPSGAGGASRSWSAGRVLAIVAAAVLLLVGVVGLGAGGTALWADQNRRNADGYLMADMGPVSTAGYAARYDVGDVTGDGWWPGDLDRWIGDVRVSVLGESGSSDVFVGIARSDDVEEYLGASGWIIAGSHGDRYDDGLSTYHQRPATPPAEQDFWAASATGSGRQTLDWPSQSGTWTLVVMNADSGKDVSAQIDAGATVPPLRGIAVGVLIGGAVFFLAGAGILYLALRSAPRPAEGTPR